MCLIFRRAIILTGYFLEKYAIMRNMQQKSTKAMIFLLEKKNSYLEEFKTLNEEEMARIQNEDFSNLESFYYDREILLNAMDRIDKQLKDHGLDQCADADQPSKAKIVLLLKNKKDSLRTILDQDMKIHEQLNLSFTVIEKIA